MDIGHYKKAIARRLRRAREVGKLLGSSWEDSGFEASYAYLNTVYRDLQSSAVPEENPLGEEVYFDLSVIVATYNRANLVCSCVDALLAQETSYLVEYILVDDGSGDETPEVLSKYEGLPNVTVIHQENRGLAGARNTGIRASRGKYLLFQDDDDILVPGAIQKMLDASRDGYYDIVQGSIVKINERGLEEVDPRKTGELQHPLGGLMGYACAKLFKRELFEKVQFPERRWFEDSIGAGLIYSDKLHVFAMEDVVYRYFETEGSITGSTGNPKNLDSLYVTRQLLRDRKTLGLPFQQENYEYFLRMAALTYERIRGLEPKVQQAVFIVTRALREEYWKDFRTERTGKLQKIESALLENQFKHYVLACERKQ